MMVITCDICKRKLVGPELEEFCSVEKHCGYGSVFGDGNLVKIDMCQHCLKDKLGEFLVIQENTV